MSTLSLEEVSIYFTIWGISVHDSDALCLLLAIQESSIDIFVGGTIDTMNQIHIQGMNITLSTHFLTRSLFPPLSLPFSLYVSGPSSHFFLLWLCILLLSVESVL